MQVPFSRILGAYITYLSVRHSYEEESGHDFTKKNGQLSDAGAFKRTKKKIGGDLIQDPFDPCKIPLLASIVYRLKSLISNEQFIQC